METAFPWNVTLFHLINASDAPNASLVPIARGLAVSTPWLAVGALVFFWLFGTVITRRSLMIAGIALGLGLAANFTIAFLTYVPRPFELGIGNTLLSHGRETSFPSDHATFLWSLGFGLLMTRPLRWLGTIIFGLGLATAWARVYLGVHFPLDMAASFVIALLAASIAQAVAGKLERVLFQPVERINTVLLRPFHRPGAKGDER